MPDARIASSNRIVRDAGDVAGVVGHLKADLDVALRAEVVDLVRMHRTHQIHQADTVVQVAVVQPQPNVAVVRILVDAVESLGVEGRCPTDQTVNLVALGEQQFGEIGTVLAGDSGHQCDLARAGNGRLRIAWRHVGRTAGQG